MNASLSKTERNLSSQQLIDRNDDLQRLRREGYEIFVHPSNHLIVKNVPYATANKTVAYGEFTAILVLSGDRTGAPKDHTIYFTGEYPCDNEGRTLEGLRNAQGRQQLADDLFIDFRFSAKPVGEPDRNYYDLVTRYVCTLWQYAQRIEPDCTPLTGRALDPDDQSSIFTYRDTASSRAGIMAVTQKLENSTVAIIGLGGTGSYVLDLVSKTPAREIHLFDGDRFSQHNAFRSPGAASLPEVSHVPPLRKVDHWHQRYGVLHRGIVPHPYFLDQRNAHELAAFDFSYICMDQPTAKKAIVNALIESGRPFIDVGMGVVLEETSLGGILRTTLSTNEKREHQKNGVSFGDVEDEYATNIQIADLNALNAALAVVRWKKMLGFYRGRDPEYSSVYTVDFNRIDNEDRLANSA